MRVFPPLVVLYERGRDARTQAKQQAKAAKAAKAAQAQAKTEDKQLARRAKLEEQADRRDLARRGAVRPVTVWEPAPSPAHEPAYAPTAAPAPLPAFYAGPAQPGASIVNVTVHAPRERQSNGAAVLLSFLIVGLGQLSQGRPAAAALWLGTAIANAVACLTIVWIPIAFFVAPLIWVLCMLDAGMYRGR
jgi:hypothetical protein